METGTHFELMAAQSVYYDLVKAQNAGYDEEDVENEGSDPNEKTQLVLRTKSELTRC